MSNKKPSPALPSYLVVIDSAFVGGMEIHTAQWVRALAAAGHRVTLLQLGKDVLSQPLSDTTAHVVHEPLNKHHGKLGEYNALGRSLKQHASDVTVLCRNGFAVVVLLALWRHARRLVTIDHAISGNIGIYNPNWQPPSRLKCSLSNMAIDHTLAVSGAVKQSAINTWRARPSKITVCHNWVDTQLHHPDENARTTWRASHGLSPHELVIGCLGRLGNDKRVTLAAAAYVEFLKSYQGDSRLVMVGRGGELEKVLAIVNASDEAKKRFLHIDWSDEPAQWHRAFDIELNLTQGEAFGLSVVETMSCGSLVLAQNKCGVDEYLIDHENGFLADLPDASTVAEKLIAIASLPQEKRSAISCAARKTAVSRFSPPVALAYLLEQLGSPQAASLVRNGSQG